MSVTREQVLATAKLARIDLALHAEGVQADAEETVTRLAAQMESIVGYMDILNQVDTTGVEPLYSPLECAPPPRPDKAEQRRTIDEILSNAPRRQGSFFAVPPVI